MIGSSKVIKEALEQLEKNGLVLKVTDLWDLQSCEIQFSEEGQLFLMESLEKKFAG